MRILQFDIVLSACKLVEVELLCFEIIPVTSWRNLHIVLKK